MQELMYFGLDLYLGKSATRKKSFRMNAVFFLIASILIGKYLNWFGRENAIMLAMLLITI
jgi:hypothetical protein